MGLQLRYNYKKIFIRFIKEYGAYNAYRNNCNFKTTYSLNVFKHGFLRNDYYVRFPFFWNSSKEGEIFWDNVNYTWLKILKHLNDSKDLNEEEISKIIKYEVQYIRRKV